MSFQVISAHRMCLAQVLKAENAKLKKGWPTNFSKYVSKYCLLITEGSLCNGLIKLE